MPKKVAVKDLSIGMFVEDLDRPWIDTPFLIQGFLIEDGEQLEQLRQTCQWVLIDPSRSVGDAFEAPPRPEPLAPRDLGSAPRVITQTLRRPAGPATTTTEKPTPARVPGARSPGRAAAEHTRHPGAAREGPLIRYAAAGRAGPPASGAADRDNTRPATDAPLRTERQSLWGQLRDGVSSLFARDAGEPSMKVDGPEPPTRSNLAPVRPAFVPETVVLTVYEDAVSVEDESGRAADAFQRVSTLLDSVVSDIRAGSNLRLESIEPVVSDMVDSMVRNPDAMMWVAKMRERDLSLYGHGLSVAVSLVSFGRHLGYPKEQLSHLGMVGLLLDVGKIKIPKEVLEKHTRLTPEEFALVREHVALGLAVLAETPNLHPDVVEAIAQHHERIDGSGYPAGLSGERIGTFGKMAAIADTFAAMTRERPYAGAVSPHEALQKLSNWGGSQFQIEMVEQFIQSIGVFPVGSLVELSNDEVAIVVTHNKFKRLRPKVLVVTDGSKQLLPQPHMFDLIYDVSDHPVYIRRGLPSNSYNIDPREYYLA
jgi:HD-GYP domain-containing protein (c-di-GMP phosphodiesterase class II)